MVHKVTKEIAGRVLEIETGRMAKQASGSVLVTYGGTMVLTTVCCSKDERDLDFLPLSVEYIEKYYAAGKIPGGFFKREGRPREREILTARLTDRPLRPLFNKKMRRDTQIISTVLSAEPANPPDILSMIGASAAVSISEVPFDGPVGAVKVGMINGELIANPSMEQIEQSELEIIIAGSKDAVMMVEGEAKELSEEQIIDAIEFGHSVIKQVVELQEELIKLAAKPKFELSIKEVDASLKQTLIDKYSDALSAAAQIAMKKERGEALSKIKDEIKETYKEQAEEDPKFLTNAIGVIEDKFKEIVRVNVIEKGIRIDGRKPNEIRQITCEPGILKNTHGSALFTRGETQALGSVTLGTSGDAQRIDDIEGESSKRFMLHYNFPPFCVGETGGLFTKRREVGHGNLAERALKSILPNEEDFPYTIRIVSEVLESNGSSSMASVCAGALALMDAGVPIVSPAAGIAMGLIKVGDKFAVISDILGTEDALGDMDFKLTGTKKGVTALQMDIKIKGVSKEVLTTALKQANEGREFILGKMAEALPAPRSEVSSNAPRLLTLQIDPEKIGMLIGPGGKNIKGLIEKHGVKIDVNDEGRVMIAGDSKEKCEAALKDVELQFKEIEPGEIYEGKVVKIMDFGAFVELTPNKDGLLHISELAKERVRQVTDIVQEGDVVKVKVLAVENGKIRLSRKALL